MKDRNDFNKRVTGLLDNSVDRYEGKARDHKLARSGLTPSPGRARKLSKSSDSCPNAANDSTRGCGAVTVDKR